MRHILFVLTFTLLSTLAFGEDPQLRARAVEMVERSLRVSEPNTTREQPYIPNETVLTFRATGPDGAVREGSYTRVFAGKTGTRQEFTMGDFHVVRFDLPGRVAVVGPSDMLPPEMRAVMRLVPIQLWRLDQDDVVHEIRQTTHKGVAVQCLEFDTIRGAHQEANELCFDAKTGAQVYDRSGNMEVENSEFFEFKGAVQPGHISQFRNGTLIVDIQVMRKVMDGPMSPDMFTPPAGAQVGIRCQTWRRAFGKSMPQPAGTGGTLNDVIVHVLIGTDGRVHNPVVENSERPDLNAEAVKLVQTWTFTPAMCDGGPNTQEANLIVHFQGR